jgi:hypothetical protein
MALQKPDHLDWHPAGPIDVLAVARAALREITEPIAVVAPLSTMDEGRSAGDEAG